MHSLKRAAAKTAGALRNFSQKSKDTVQLNEINNWPRKIFSGIQPTGALHLGNYLGAVQKWTQLQNSNEDVTFCIVDMHSITLPQDPVMLRENIFQMASTMLACGIDPDRSTIFVQSAVQEHTQLGWILNCMSTMARLGHLPQYKEKTRKMKDIPLGLFVYPVLQAADIMLYKTTHVPVGEDQVQHIQLAQHLARTFNARYGPIFPVCHAIIENKEAARIRSLRDPSKKMSKSDPDTRATITIMDEPEVIVEKFKKAMTDFTSDVTFAPDMRPGVSNLVAIHALVTDQDTKKIVDEAQRLNTAEYKLRVADAVVEHLRPIRVKVQQQLLRRSELHYILDMGASKAREVAQCTMAEVAQRMGLGTLQAPVLPLPERVPEEQEHQIGVATTAVWPTATELLTKSAPKPESPPVDSKTGRPVVPKQKMRVEKAMRKNVDILRVDVDQKMAQAHASLKAAGVGGGTTPKSDVADNASLSDDVKLL